MNKQVKVGLIVNTQGLKGDIRVYPLTDYKERFQELKEVYINPSNPIELNIEKVRYKKNLVILKFKNLDSINDVEKYKDQYLYISEKELRKLPRDTYYIIDIIGSKVYDDKNIYLGEIIDVIQNSAQDIYVIALDKSVTSTQDKLLLPAVKEFIKNIDLEKKTIKVTLIEGMLEWI